MKTRTTVLAIIFSIMTSGLMAQEKSNKNYLWKYEGKKREQYVGGYLGLSGSYTDVMGRGAGWLSGRIGVVFNHRFTVGVAGSALWYDYQLDRLTTSGTCHLETGYAGIFGEYMQPLGSRVKLGFSLVLGQGVAKYTYDKDFREGKPWYEQTIDQQNYTVTEPGVEALVRIAPKWWIGVNGSWRFTSPVGLKNTLDDLFNNFSGGVSHRFGLL